MPEDARLANGGRQPDEHGRHQRTFEAGFGEVGFTGFIDLVRGDIERLANRVGRPCRVVVNIEVYDLDDEEVDDGE